MRENKLRAFWNLIDPCTCKLCVSSRMFKEDPGAPLRYGIGEGQIYALPYVITSLINSYGDSFNWKNFIHANDPDAKKLFDAEKWDLIMLGGWYTNPCATSFIEWLRPRLKIEKFSNKELQFEIDGFKHLFEVEGVLRTMTESRCVDIALIISCNIAEGNEHRRAVLIAGCNTYGTGAAARYFCEKMVDNTRWKDMKGRDYIAVLRCVYNGNQTVRVKVEEPQFFLF